MEQIQDSLYVLCVTQSEIEALMKVIPSIKFMQVVGKEFDGMQAVCTPLPPKQEAVEASDDTSESES